MDVLRSAGSYGSDRQSLLREPSAEDLDAAHQLVSSARGERKNLAPTQEPPGSDARELQSRQQEGGKAEVESQQPRSELQEREVAGSFSQVCR
jgi:hypothetical protein